MIFQMIKAGLDGIEIVHPKLSERRTRHLQQLVQKNDLLVSGGSDCHGGRNGAIQLGKFNVPYVIVENMRNELRKRHHDG